MKVGRVLDVGGLWMYSYARQVGEVGVDSAKGVVAVYLESWKWI